VEVLEVVGFLVDAEHSSVQGVLSNGFIVKVVLESRFVPLVAFDSHVFLFSNVLCILEPCGEQHSASVLFRTTVAAFIFFRVVKVPVPVNYYMAARSVFKKLESIRSAEAVVSSVISVNLVSFN